MDWDLWDRSRLRRRSHPRQLRNPPRRCLRMSPQPINFRRAPRRRRSHPFPLRRIQYSVSRQLHELGQRLPLGRN